MDVAVATPVPEEVAATPVRPGASLVGGPRVLWGRAVPLVTRAGKGGAAMEVSVGVARWGHRRARPAAHGKAGA